MEKEYIIINKTALEKRIEELENVIEEKKIGVENERWLKHELKQILSQSTPLVPEIEKAYIAGEQSRYSRVGEAVLQKEYISNLKLDI